MVSRRRAAEAVSLVAELAICSSLQDSSREPTNGSGSEEHNPPYLIEMLMEAEESHRCD